MDEREVDMGAQINTRLPAEMRERLEVVAREQLVTVSDVVRWACRDYLASQGKPQPQPQEALNES